MKITVENNLALENIPSCLFDEVVDLLSFSNPKWEENEKHGRWQGATPRLLKFYEHDPHGGLIVPRGFARQLLSLCKRLGVKYKVVDKRGTLPEVDFRFKGKLRPFQREGVRAMAVRDFGTLSAPTGSGKTIMALWLIAHREQPTLIVVHTKELLNQWVNRIGTFLDIPVEKVGIIGDGKKIIGEKITVALVQSLYKCADEIAPYIGHLVVDECHRCPSRTFVGAVTVFDCKYMLGLSATPWRRDKLSRLIFWHLGDVVHEIKKDDLVETGDVLKAEVILRETDFRPWSDPSTEYSSMLSELTEDPDRNDLIVSDVAGEAQNGGGICLVLSDRKSHCEALSNLLKTEHAIQAEVLTGDKGKRDREGIVERLNTGKVKVLIATGQLIGEGFDCKELSTLFLTTPIKFNGRVLQYLGRVLRPAPGKDKATVYDYVDINVPVLQVSATARRRVYGA